MLTFAFKNFIERSGAQRMADHLVPVGNRYYWKSNFLTGITDGLIDVLARGASNAVSPLSLVLLFEIKDAIRRVNKADMAFDHRNSGYEMSIIANWTEARETRPISNRSGNSGWPRNPMCLTPCT